MPNPVETNYIDRFNRTAESPLSDGGNWISPGTDPDFIDAVATDGTQVISDITFGFQSAMRTAATYGPNCECGFLVTGMATGGIGALRVYLRISNPNSYSMTGYYIDCPRNRSGTDEWRMFRIDASTPLTFTQIGSSAFQEVASGDLVSGQMIGNTLRMFYKASGGSWSELGNTTDSTYTGVGYLGFSVAGEAVTADYKIDDFFGQTIIDAPPVFDRHRVQRTQVFAQ